MAKPRKNDRHPTMKPVELMEWAIRNSSNSRDIELDPFGGSGSTLIACKKTGRSACLIEFDPKYVDVLSSAGRSSQEEQIDNQRVAGVPQIGIRLPYTPADAFHSVRKTCDKYYHTP